MEVDAVYLQVPYAEKDDAKSLGARWDSQAKLWYDPGPEYNPQLDKWAKFPSVLPHKPVEGLSSPWPPTEEMLRSLPIPQNDATIFSGREDAGFAPVQTDRAGRRYLAVPFAAVEMAKSLGALWDAQAKLWYEPGPEFNSQLDKWFTETPNAVQMRKYLTVPFKQKDEAKALGAKWDPSAKRWYDPTGSNSALARWDTNESSPAS